MRSLFFLAATLAAILLATPVKSADLGSPVPMPTGDSRADVASLADYLKERDAATTAILLDLSRQLADLKTRVSAGERFAAKMGGYVPPATATAAAPAAVQAKPAPAVAVLPPSAPGILARPAVVTSTSSPVGIVTAPTPMFVQGTVRRGGTRGGPLGLGILPKLMGGYCGGGVDPTPGYAIQYAPAYAPTYALPAANCPPGGCPVPSARSYGYTAASH